MWAINLKDPEIRTHGKDSNELRENILKVVNELMGNESKMTTLSTTELNPGDILSLYREVDFQ